jgi:hypothetical protein
MIRKGMWVVDQDGAIGIAHQISAEGQVEFHKVDAAGCTQLVVLVPIDSLVQARYREIPEPRRTLTREQFAARGYH